MTEGNWRLGVFVDEKAGDDQLAKLVAVFGGQLAGRWPRSARWWARCSAWSGPRSRSPRRTAAQRAGRDVIDFEVEEIVPFGVTTGEPVRSPGCSTRWPPTWS